MKTRVKLALSAFFAILTGILSYIVYLLIKRREKEVKGQIGVMKYWVLYTILFIGLGTTCLVASLTMLGIAGHDFYNSGRGNDAYLDNRDPIQRGVFYGDLVHSGLE